MYLTKHYWIPPIILALFLASCDQNQCGDLNNDSSAPSQSIYHLQTYFVENQVAEEIRYTPAILINPSQPVDPIDLRINFTGKTEYSQETGFSVNLSLFKQAYACTRVSIDQPLENSIESIRIYIKTTSDPLVNEGQ